MSAVAASIIVPAHNEEAVIARTLESLLREAKPGEFELIVVCNGCSDRTAQVVQAAFPFTLVLELAEASKTAALNAGLSAAQGSVVLLLDADIELGTRAARSLLEAVQRPGVEAAIGHMDIDTTGVSAAVRAFYRVWLHHPYLRNGKFAAAIALSRAGIARVGSMPPVTADDTYLRRTIPAEAVAVVDSARFLVRVPRDLGALVRVRSRSHRGTAQLEAHAPTQLSRRTAEVRSLLAHVGRRPSMWADALVYLTVTLAARCRARLHPGVRWERDQTSRLAVTGQRG